MDTMTPDARPQSLWQREAAEAAPRLAGDRQVDLAIVGAGLGGLWLAYWLRHWGRRVVVLEREQPAAGASGRNAGFVLAGTADLYGATVDRLGRDAARQWLRLSRQNREGLAALARLAPDGLGFLPTGSLYLAAPDEAETLRRTVDLLKEDGVPALLQTPDDLPAPLARLGFPLAAVFPEDGQVHPVRVAGELWRRAEADGVAIFGDTPVTAVDTTADGYRLTTPGGTVVATRVVLTLNAWLPLLIPEVAPWIRPVRGQVLSTAPLPPIDERPVYADHGFLYWRQRPDGRLIVGGYRQLDFAGEVGYGLDPHPLVQQALLDLAGRIAGGPVTVEHRWAGTMAFTPDHLPVVTELSPGLLLAGGYSGHGVALTGAVGSLIARHLDRGEPLPAILARTRPSLGLS
jgi:gamma-glutamylputrescine oxidase